MEFRSKGKAKCQRREGPKRGSGDDHNNIDNNVEITNYKVQIIKDKIENYKLQITNYKIENYKLQLRGDG